MKERLKQKLAGQLLTEKEIKQVVGGVKGDFNTTNVVFYPVESNGIDGLGYYYKTEGACGNG